MRAWATGGLLISRRFHVEVPREVEVLEAHWRLFRELPAPTYTALEDERP
eukprot:COSAG02_NODE_395_length_23127_cov_130.205663_5_plen_50_part_00